MLARDFSSEGFSPGLTKGFTASPGRPPSRCRFAGLGTDHAGRDWAGQIWELFQGMIGDDMDDDHPFFEVAKSDMISLLYVFVY